MVKLIECQWRGRYYKSVVSKMWMIILLLGPESHSGPHGVNSATEKSGSL